MILQSIICLEQKNDNLQNLIGVHRSDCCHTLKDDVHIEIKAVFLC